MTGLDTNPEDEQDSAHIVDVLDDEPPSCIDDEEVRPPTRRSKAPLLLLRMLGQDSYEAGMLNGLKPGRYVSAVHPDPFIIGTRLGFLTPFTGSISFEVDQQGDLRDVEILFHDDTRYRSWPSHRMVAKKKGALRRSGGRYAISAGRSRHEYVADRPMHADGEVTMLLHTRNVAISDEALQAAEGERTPNRVEDDPDVLLDVVSGRAMPMRLDSNDPKRPIATLTWMTELTSRQSPMLIVKPVMGAVLPKGGVYDGASDSWICHASRIDEVLKTTGSIDVMLGGRDDRIVSFDGVGPTYRRTRIDGRLHAILLERGIDPAVLAAQESGRFSVHSGHGSGGAKSADFLPPSFPSGTVSHLDKWVFRPSAPGRWHHDLDPLPRRQEVDIDPEDKPLPDRTPWTWTTRDGDVNWIGDVATATGMASEPIDHAHGLARLIEDASPFWRICDPGEWTSCTVTVSGRATVGQTKDEVVIRIEMSDALESEQFRRATSDLDMHSDWTIFRASPSKVDFALLMATLAHTTKDILVTDGSRIIGMTANMDGQEVPRRTMPDGDGCIVGRFGQISPYSPERHEWIEEIHRENQASYPHKAHGTSFDEMDGPLEVCDESEGIPMIDIDMHAETVDPFKERIAAEELDIIVNDSSVTAEAVPEARNDDVRRLDATASGSIRDVMGALVRTAMKQIRYSDAGGAVSSLRKASDTLRDVIDADAWRSVSAYVELLEAEFRDSEAE
jgi:hypothetical protein